jgi:hypothetical protein
MLFSTQQQGLLWNITATVPVEVSKTLGETQILAHFY